MTLLAGRRIRMDDASAQNVAEVAHGGGRLATVISACAFAFSGYSLYESALKAPELEVFVPPVIQYARDAGGDTELFAIPITITNGGANTGTVLSIDLTVENPRGGTDAPKLKRYYSAFLGEHPRNPDAARKSFAPVSIPGRGTYSDTIRFYAQGNPLPKLVDAEGAYRFTLALNIARPEKPGVLERLLTPPPPPALTFTMTLPWISEQQLGMRRATIDMHSEGYRPMSGAAR